MKKSLLFKLTVDEFTEIWKTALEEIINKKSEENSIPEARDTISIKEVSEITGLKTFTIYSKVSKGEIPVLRRGKPLRFSRKEIEAWMKRTNK